MKILILVSDEGRQSCGGCDRNSRRWQHQLHIRTSIQYYVYVPCYGVYILAQLAKHAVMFLFYIFTFSFGFRTRRKWLKKNPVIVTSTVIRNLAKLQISFSWSKSYYIRKKLLDSDWLKAVQLYRFRIHFGINLHNTNMRIFACRKCWKIFLEAVFPHSFQSFQKKFLSSFYMA